MSFPLYLAKKGVVADSDVSQITAESEKLSGGIDEALLKRGLKIDQLLQLKAEYYGMPARLLDGYKVPPEILKYVPEESARHYGIAPIGIEENVLAVGIIDPDQTPARDAVQFISSKLGMPFRLYVVTQIDLNEILTQYQNLSGEVTRALDELSPESTTGDDLTPTHVDESIDNEHEHEEGTGVEKKIVEDAPVTKIVAVILKHAVDGNASDVHIEHMGDKIRVRFRVDGVMYVSLILPVNVHSAIVARIKILANLKLDEKRKPQDGRFSAKMDGRKVDFRVSTFPAYYGEKVVMRILDPSKGVKSLDSMGLSAEQMAIIKDALATPYGMILITGPTGSGKSTTLYSMLNELDREKRNVISLEDPVEYNIQGVNQSQVRPEIGYTFANGLRSILRQDPDIIMVGEIRDKETAQLAVQAALTGHLVFSTLHTNNAAGVIPRLIDMEVDPYLIAPTLVLAIGQRLLRTLCPDGKKEIPISESMRLMIDRQFADLPEAVRSKIEIPDTIYEAKPSPSCPSGTKGRTGVYEFLKMDRELEHVILTNPVEQAVYDAARAKGMLTMRDDALKKAFTGVIPFEEVNNIV
jgi:type IV pilus assembly protein PilB